MATDATTAAVIAPTDNPCAVSEPEDRIQQIPEGMPGWSENINFCCPTGQDEVGVYAHMSRLHDDPTVWESVLSVYLPGGELLVDRSFGRSRAANESSSGQLTFTVEEPLHRWSMRFDGMARRITRADAASGTVADGSVELLRIDLSWESASPVWSLAHAMGDQPWGKLHLEQAVRVTGTITTREQTHNVDHTAFRDHTAGQRDYSPLDGEAWLTFALPDGRHVALLQMWHSGDVSALRTGFYYDGQTFHHIDQIDIPPLTSATGDPADFTFSFDGPHGRIEGRAQLDHSMVFTLDEPIGMPLGCDLAHGLVVVEGPARYEVEGQRAHGWIERCRRTTHL